MFNHRTLFIAGACLRLFTELSNRLFAAIIRVVIAVFLLWAARDLPLPWNQDTQSSDTTVDQSPTAVAAFQLQSPWALLNWVFEILAKDDTVANSWIPTMTAWERFSWLLLFIHFCFPTTAVKHLGWIMTERSAASYSLSCSLSSTAGTRRGRRPRLACDSLPSSGSGDSCVALLPLAPCPETAVAINKQRWKPLAGSPASFQECAEGRLTLAQLTPLSSNRFLRHFGEPAAGKEKPKARLEPVEPQEPGEPEENKGGRQGTVATHS